MTISGNGEALPMCLALSEAGPIDLTKGGFMLAYQLAMPIRQPLAARQRSLRRPFHPSPSSGPYRLPHDVRDRLTASLAPFRNRDAAFALATFLGRFWSMPSRIAGSFPIDRRALSDRGDLVLTEAQVRGAIKTLEAVGFIERAIRPKGSGYRLTDSGGLQRKAVLYVFGGEYAPSFIKANRQAAAARGGNFRISAPILAKTARRASVTLSVAQITSSPKDKSAAERKVIMGEVTKESGLPASAFDLDPRLEAALARLEEGFRRSRGG